MWCCGCVSLTKYGIPSILVPSRLCPNLEVGGELGNTLYRTPRSAHHPTAILRLLSLTVF
jgi:hypothetical protein